MSSDPEKHGVELAQPLPVNLTASNGNNHINNSSVVTAATLVSNNPQGVSYSTNDDPEKGTTTGYAPQSGNGHVNGTNGDAGGVDVEKAKAEFHALERRMSERSSIYRAQSRGSSGNADLEKGDEDQPFNLLDTIRGEVDTRNQQGFKQKQVGVYWEHLKVIGGGGVSELLSSTLQIPSHL